MKKITKNYLLIIAIILVVYSVLVFVIPFTKMNMATFVISYIASVIALLSQVYVAYIAFKGEDNLTSKVYGFPIIKLGYIYLGIQFALSILFYILGAFIDVPVWICIVLYVLVLGLAAVGLITTSTYKEAIEEIEVKKEDNKVFIKELRRDTLVYSSKIKDQTTKDLFDKFLDIVRYSDPVSNENLKEIENEINSKYEEIKVLVSHDNYLVANKEIENLIDLVNRRNLMCKEFKK